MGKNGQWATHKKIPFFSKRKKWSYSRKKNNGQKMGTLKKNVIRKKNVYKSEQKMNAGRKKIWTSPKKKNNGQ